MTNAQRLQAVATFNRNHGPETRRQGNDLLVFVSCSLYDFLKWLPEIRKLNKEFSWDETELEVCHLEVYSTRFKEEVALVLTDFFEYEENEVDNSEAS